MAASGPRPYASLPLSEPRGPENRSENDGQAHAQHGNALSHGTKHGLKYHSKALCASKSKKHGRKHRGNALCHGKKHGLKRVAPSVSSSVDSSRSSAVAQYGTRPGKGCGDRNHVHTGPPGNPSNTRCPPQSHHG